MAGIVTRGGISALLAPDLRKVHMEVGKERRKEYPLIFNVSEMDWNPMTDQQVSGLGTMPGKESTVQFTLDSVIMGGTKTYTASPYGLAVSISWEAWRDELYGVLKEMVRCIARAGHNREEVAAFSALNNAFSTSYTGFTASESLCSTSHTPLGAGVTAQANRPSPDIGLSHTGIQAGILHFHSLTDERGMPQVLSPTMALVTSADVWTARELFGSAGRPYTTDNEINALVDEDLRYMVCHYITTSTYWFMLAAQGNHDLNFFWRDMPIFDMFDDPRTKCAYASGYQRHTDGAWGSWKGVYGSTG